MTNEQILKKAIKKAFGKDYYICNEVKKYPILIIFSHSFAKAFWVDEVYEKTNTYLDNLESYPTWRYHLQQMVLEKEPLKYLEKFL